MLSLRSSLSFPKLVFLKEVDLVHSNGEKPIKTLPLFKLDWEAHDIRMLKRHTDWVQEHWAHVEIPFVPFPEEYDEQIKGFTFALSTRYLSEIKRMSQKALQEWNIERRFDTVVREACLAPAIEFIFCAFYLLEDCVYDEDKRWFTSYEERFIAKYLMSFKFWYQQTGYGLISKHSHSECLEEQIKYAEPAAQKTIIEWLETIKKFCEDLEESRRGMFPNKSVFKDQPSLGEK